MRSAGEPEPRPSHSDARAADDSMVDPLDRLFANLSREPDFDAPELQAHDATDRLLLDTAAELGGAQLDPARDGGIVVIGDRHGALTLGAALLLDAHGIRVHQDALLGERALSRNAERLGLAAAFKQHGLDESLLSGARLVLLQLPRGLAALDEIAQLIARHAHPGVVVLAGGRDKHMTRAMNDTLGRSFAEVSAGLGRRKSRVLTARVPRPGAELGDPRLPVWGADPDLDFRVAAFGATFGGATLDHGSRLLLRGLQREGWPQAATVVDLGCGTGVLAVSAARSLPGARVIATDQSAAAVAATRLTAEAAGVAGPGVEVLRADATEAVPDGWADLILLNPPFHSGSTVHTEVAHRLIRSCARALALGGELRLVFNSQLGYRPLVERVIGPVRQVDRDRTFTVIAATRR